MLAALAAANRILSVRANCRRCIWRLPERVNSKSSAQPQAQSEHLAGCVHFLGFVRDRSPLWAAAQAAIFCSEAEGLCTALIEAQGAGVPAIVTRARAG